MKLLRTTLCAGVLACCCESAVIAQNDAGQEASEEPAAEGGETVQQPSGPPAVQRRSSPLSPNAREIQFTFSNAPWESVIEWFADISGLALQMEIKPTGTFNYIQDPMKYTLPEVMDILNEDLILQGHYLIRRGNFLKVIALEDADPPVPPHLIPQVKARDLPNRARSEFVKVWLDAGSVLAEMAAEEVGQLKGQYGRVSALKGVNKLLVIDTVENCLQMKELLEALTEGGLTTVQTKDFKLVWAPARDVEVMIRQQMGLPPRDATGQVQSSSRRSSDPREDFRRQIMERFMGRSGGSGFGGRDSSRGSSGSTRSRGSTGGSSSRTAGGTPEPDVFTSVDDRINTLYITAPADKMARVERLVETMDTPSDGQDPFKPELQIPTIQVYRLSDGDAESLVQALQAIYQNKPSVRFAADTNNNSVVVTATPTEQKDISALVTQFENDERNITVLELTRLNASEMSDLFNQVLASGETDFRGRPVVKPGQPRIEADLSNNRLLVRASARQVEVIRTTLQAMGEPLVKPMAGTNDRMRVFPLGGNAEEVLQAVERVWGSRVKVMRPRSSNPGLSPSEAPRGDGRASPRTNRGRGPSRPGANPPATDSTQPSIGGPRNPEALPEKAPKTSPKKEPEKKPEKEPTRSTAREVPVRFIAQEPKDSEPKKSQTSEQPQQPENQQGDDQPSSGAVITVVDGNLVVGSDDPELLQAISNTVEALTRRGGAMGGGAGYRVFYLNASDATQITETLNNLLGTTSTGGFFSTPSNVSLKIVPDVRTNSIIVSGTPNDIEQVRQLLDVLDAGDVPNSAAVSTPRIIPVRYSSASDISQIIKDVYAQKIGNNNSNQNSSRGFGGFRGRSNQPTAQTGAISVGVDTRSNSIIVSCSESTFYEIQEMVDVLDLAANDTQRAVNIVRMSGSTSASSVQSAISGLLGTPATTQQQRGPSNNANQPQQPQNARPGFPGFTGGFRAGSPFGGGFNRGGGTSFGGRSGGFTPRGGGIGGFGGRGGGFSRGRGR